MAEVVRRTINQASFVKYDSKRSIFYAFASPVFCPEDANAFVDCIRKRYPDASHHVYAWKTSSPSVFQKYSDDNEPSGTAGFPIMDMINRQGIVDLSIVVVRYFGGIKLGTGGLQRAYVHVAERSIALAQPVAWIRANRYRVITSYSSADKLKHMFSIEGIVIETVSYDTHVVFEILCPSMNQKRCKKGIMDLTSGQAQIVFIDEAEMKREILNEHDKTSLKPKSDT